MPPRRVSSPAAKRAAAPSTPPAPPANVTLHILKFALKNLGLPLLLCVAEKTVLPKFVPALSTPGPVLGLPRAFGLVAIVNIFGTALFTIGLGVGVGSARGKFTERATKDGDADAEARFSYPKMYAEGFGPLAREFNCVQRSHQHTLETYPHVLAMSIVGGLSQPVTTALAGALWIFARAKWASGYQTGDPKNRYEKSDGWGRHIWTALLALIVTCFSTGIQCLAF